ncbi:MAG: PEP-CTERM sorting domain-containing protein [Cyanobacteria bacterium P01_H01_bin.35]
MIPKFFKQIALATIGTSCVAFGVATEAQAFGALNISNENGFTGNTTEVTFSNTDLEYSATGDFSFLTGDDGSVNATLFSVPGGPVNSWFTFDDGPFVFNLNQIDLAGTFGDTVFYDLIGTITDNMGTTLEVDGQFTSQMVDQSAEEGSSWSITLETIETTKVPEPSTMLGLGLVGAASAFGLKKKNS